MSEPWSPGPWEVTLDDNGYWVMGPRWVFSDNNDAALEKEADARLIALAPEMAQMIEALSDELTGHHNAMWRNEDGTVTRPCRVVTEATAFLARARGIPIPDDSEEG